ncbi:DUF305 domain-containing protein [Pseudorhodoferax soli]|uniref:DUF305 family protein family protein n=1 Tax=Pseudorhodoferax soli TaxID=545864 RepID=A0A368XRC4_9BURK|nr:DUF305 domain-containing protein [Pseudorhodoferax soli]RCW68564.1 DUF305 family protein family protein [Pseudorhodoferax soli]
MIGIRTWSAAACTMGRCSVAVAAAVLLVGATSSQDMHHHQRKAQREDQFQHDMDVSMQRMMSDMHGPGYSGSADRDFLVMMIPHHQGAVDMARLVLKHGRDPATRQLAEEIIATQTVEIEGMRRRLSLLRGNEGSAADEYPALGGLRGR